MECHATIALMIEETFTAYDIRATLQPGASLEFAWNVGRALAEWLSTTGSVAVARGENADEELVGALIEGLRLQGRDVVDAGSRDKEVLISLVQEAGHSGAVLVAHDKMTNEVTIELYKEEGRLVDSETGLYDVKELITAGNFVPAAVKGDVTTLA